LRPVIRASMSGLFSGDSAETAPIRLSEERAAADRAGPVAIVFAITSFETSDAMAAPGQDLIELVPGPARLALAAYSG
jgi:hypothetical protein